MLEQSMNDSKTYRSSGVLNDSKTKEEGGRQDNEGLLRLRIIDLETMIASLQFENSNLRLVQGLGNGQYAQQAPKKLSDPLQFQSGSNHASLQQQQSGYDGQVTRSSNVPIISQRSIQYVSHEPPIAQQPQSHSHAAHMIMSTPVHAQDFAFQQTQAVPIRHLGSSLSQRHPSVNLQEPVRLVQRI